MKLFLGPDDQIEQMQRRLQFRRHLGAFDEAAFALAMPGHAPEIRAIVDIQRRLRPVLPRQFQRLQHRRPRARMRQMRPRRQNRPRLTDEALVDILLGQPHIRAILAIEDQRETVLIPDPQNDQRRQPLRIHLHPANIHALAHQLLTNEPPHMLVADTRDDGGLQPEPRRPAGNIRRRATDILAERPHVLQPATNLVAIQVNRRTTNRDKVQGFHATASRM